MKLTHHSLSFWLATVLPLVLAASLSYLQPLLRQTFVAIQSRAIQDVELEYSRHLESGLALYSKGLYDDAFRVFRHALNLADTDKERATAGLALGQVLLSMDASRGRPRLVAANQYLTAALELSQSSPERMRALSLLLEAAVEREDSAFVQRAAERILEEPLSDDQKVALYGEAFNALLPMGSWDELQPFVAYLRKVRRQGGGDGAVVAGLREVYLANMLMERDDLRSQWLAAYSTGGTQQDREVVVMQQLRQAILNRLDRLAGVAKGEQAEEIQYWRAKTLFADGQIGAASDALTAFLRMEPTVRLRESEDLMLQMVTAEGEFDRFEALVDPYVGQFGWTSTLIAQIVKVLETLKAEGNPERALAMIEAFMAVKRANDRGGEAPTAMLTEYAADLAWMLEDDALIHRFYEKLVDIPSMQWAYPRAYLRRAYAYERQGETVRSYDMLYEFVERSVAAPELFPAALALLDRLDRHEVGHGDLVAIALSLAERLPENPYSVDAMMLAARVLESMKMYAVAYRFYNQSALLSSVRQGRGVSSDRNSLINQASLGSARCLVEMKEEIEADHLLRKLCNDLLPGAVRNEAAFLWARLAFRSGQSQEGQRRLALIDPLTMSADLQQRVEREQLMVAVSDPEATGQEAEALLEQVESLPAGLYPRFVTAALRDCLLLYGRLDQIDGMEHVYRVAMERGDMTPGVLDELRLQLVEALVREERYEEARALPGSEDDEISRAITDIARMKAEAGKVL